MNQDLSPNQLSSVQLEFPKKGVLILSGLQLNFWCDLSVTGLEFFCPLSCVPNIFAVCQSLFIISEIVNCQHSKFTILIMLWFNINSNPCLQNSNLSVHDVAGWVFSACSCTFLQLFYNYFICDCSLPRILNH